MRSLLLGTFSQHAAFAYYEPELFPGLVYKVGDCLVPVTCLAGSIWLDSCTCGCVCAISEVGACCSRLLSDR